MKEEYNVFCVKLTLWLIVAQKGTIFHIFESGAEYGAECSAESGAKQYFIYMSYMLNERLQEEEQFHSKKCREMLLHLSTQLRIVAQLCLFHLARLFHVKLTTAFLDRTRKIEFTKDV